jgi:hypothetical protein
MALVGLILTLDTDVAGRVKEFLALAKDIDRIKQARLQRRLFKTGGRLIRYARHFILQLAESWPRAT